jgi:hypothetical protein
MDKVETIASSLRTARVPERNALPKGTEQIVRSARALGGTLEDGA